MRASTRNLLWGAFHKMKGSVRTAVGNGINSRRVVFSGRVERAGGIAQSKFGKIERICGW